MKSATAFLIVAVGIAVIALGFFGGIALVMHNGQSQSCASSGGQWVATDKPLDHGNGGVERSRECRR